MSPQVCARRWEVEAVRDGRLQGKDTESLARHLLVCAECTRESAALSTLAQAVREVPVRVPDQLSVRRQRQSLLLALERSFETHAGLPRRRYVMGFLVGAAAVAMLALAGGWLFSRRSAGEPSVDVIATPGAVWHRASDHGVVRIFVEDGELRLSVHRGRSTARVLIVPPDGEIEDLGTVLHVKVAARLTREIVVEEGLVSARLHGVPEQTLGAGQSWSRAPDPPPPSAQVPSAPSGASASSTSGTSGTTNAASLASPPAIEARARRAGAAAASGRPAVGVGGVGGAPHAGPNAPARSASRAEDDAYLAIVSLLEQGQSAEARAAALDYLARFPKGFRAAEVAEVAKR